MRCNSRCVDDTHPARRTTNAMPRSVRITANTKFTGRREKPIRWNGLFRRR
jgi:hypothetical protein